MLLLIVTGCSDNPPYQSIVLRNGLKTVLFDHHSPISNAMFILNGGISTGEPGVMRVTTDMLLRGTAVRTVEQMNEEIELLGGRIDARSGLNVSYVMIEAPRKQFIKCFEIFCEVLTQPAFEEEQIDHVMKNKKSMMWEILIDKGEYNEEFVRPLLFRGSPVSRKWEDQKETITREEIIRQYEEWFRPANGILVLNGRMDRKIILKMASELWNKKDKGQDTPHREISLGDLAEERTVTKKTDKGRDQVQVGFRAPFIFSEDYITTELLTILFGSGKNSIISQQWLSENKYDYFVDSYFITNPDLGFVWITLDVPAGKNEEVISFVTDELEKLKREEIPVELITIAKRKAISRYAIRLSDPLRFNLFFGMASMIEAPYRSFEDIEKRVKSVTADELQKTAARVFQDPVFVILQAK